MKRRPYAALYPVKEIFLYPDEGQVVLVEDLIAKGVDVILVMSNDPESLIPAF